MGRLRCVAGLSASIEPDMFTYLSQTARNFKCWNSLFYTSQTSRQIEVKILCKKSIYQCPLVVSETLR
jgi:hypothetical protein